MTMSSANQLPFTDSLDGSASLFDSSSAPSVPLASASSADLAGALHPPSTSRAGNSSVSDNSSISISAPNDTGPHRSRSTLGIPLQGKDSKTSINGSAAYETFLPWRNQERHRHSDKLDEATNALIELADQAITSRTTDTMALQDHMYPGTPQFKSIVQNLEGHGWVYHGTTQGIRIFSKEDDHEDLEGYSYSTQADEQSGRHRLSMSSALKEDHASSKRARNSGENARSMSGIRGKAKSGVRAHETLPFFRGEGWIEGSWKIEDIQHTIVSIGARGAWDPPFDAGKSTVVAYLSQHDNLSQIFFRGSFISNRDACVATSLLKCPGEIGYVTSVSVQDALVPKSGTRTTIHLNGYCIRALQAPPLFEGAGIANPVSDETSTAFRPNHRRTPSSMSFALGAGLIKPPKVSLEKYSGTARPFAPSTEPQYPSSISKNGPDNLPSRAPARQSMHPQASYMSYNSATSAQLGDYDSDRAGEDGVFDYPEYTISRSTIPVNQVQDKPVDSFGNGPGVHVSLVLNATPGSNLPFTFVKNLSLNLPLSIASINQYLMTRGFAPYIIRRPKSEGMTVIDERFDAHSSIYKVLYKVSAELQDGETKIRFFGSTFAKGNFTIQVQRADNWHIEYDVEPQEPPQTVIIFEGKEHRRHAEKELIPDTSKGSEKGPYAENGGSKTVSVVGSPEPIEAQSLGIGSSDGISAESRRVKDNINSPAPAVVKDPALQAGPKGGCTLCISNKSAAGNIPVSVIISKSSDRSKAPLDLLKKVSTTLAYASNVTYEDNPIETVEQLLDTPYGERRAEMNLMNARDVLRRLNMGQGGLNAEDV